MADKLRKLFEAEKVGIFLDGIGHRKVKLKDGDAPMLDLDVRIEPLTPELATEIDPEIKRALFELTSGEPRPLVSRVAFKLQIPQQNVHIYATPDTDRARLVFDRCDVSRVVARRVKDIDCFGLTFRLSFSHPSKDQHAYLAEHLYQQFFATTEQTDPDLFEDRTPAHTPRKTKAEAEQPRLVEGTDEENQEAGDEADPESEAVVEAVEEARREAGRSRLPVKRARDPRKATKAKKAAKRGGKRR